MRVDLDFWANGRKVEVDNISLLSQRNLTGGLIIKTPLSS